MLLGYAVDGIGGFDIEPVHADEVYQEDLWTSGSGLIPPGYVRDMLLPARATGAAEAGREVPCLVTVVHAALARPGRNPCRLARTGAGEHLRAPQYTDMPRRAGLRVHPARSDLGARALVDSGAFLTSR